MTTCTRTHGQHTPTCTGDNCTGCQPCNQPVCRTCKTTHTTTYGTCPDCLTKVRHDLTEIGRLVAALPAEVQTKGANSEAMNLLGPTSDTERDGHIAASIAAGRIDRDDYETVTDADKLHPRHVIGCWDMLVRDALEHEEAPDWTIAIGIRYLYTQLTYLAGYPHLEFPELAQELHDCRRHLERVLHDGDQIETGAPCMTCRVPLRREWATLATADGWRCPRCNDWRSDQDYKLNVAELHRAQAEWLTGPEMATRTGIRAGTIREWARKGRPEQVRKRRENRHTVYSVTDVERVARSKGMMSA